MKTMILTVLQSTESDYKYFEKVFAFFSVLKKANQDTICKSIINLVFYSRSGYRSQIKSSWIKYRSGTDGKWTAVLYALAFWELENMFGTVHRAPRSRYNTGRCSSQREDIGTVHINHNLANPVPICEVGTGRGMSDNNIKQASSSFI